MQPKVVAANSPGELSEKKLAKIKNSMMLDPITSKKMLMYLAMLPPYFLSFVSALIVPAISRTKITTRPEISSG
jgi:hypothetical protein